MDSAGAWCTVSWTDEGSGTACVVVTGEVDAATAPMLSEALCQATAVAGQTVAVDLGTVTFMDAAGLRVLLLALDAAAGRQLRLRLDPISRPVLRLLEAAQVTERFELSTGPAQPA